MFSTLELRVGDAYPALMILSSDSYSGSLPDSLDASLFNLPRRSSTNFVSSLYLSQFTNIN